MLLAKFSQIEMLKGTRLQKKKRKRKYGFRVRLKAQSGRRIIKKRRRKKRKRLTP